jgi:AcrR family transcriptional regulator
MSAPEERRRSARRDEAKATTRRRVLAAAMEVFAREGYHAARMDAIAEEAGVSKGALYFHFPGKLQLFSALVDAFAAELAADAAAAIAAHRGGVARVKATVAAALTVLGRRRALARIVLIEAASLGPAYAEKRREILGRFAALVRDHLDEAIAEGSIPPVDTSVAAYAWLGALNEVVMQSLQGELPALANVAPALSELLLRSVGVADAGVTAGR